MGKLLKSIIALFKRPTEKPKPFMDIRLVCEQGHTHNTADEATKCNQYTTASN